MGLVKKTKAACSGCYNDDYNRGLGGAKECWRFESATIKKRLGIPVDMRPPYDASQAKLMMSCYEKKRMVYVTPEKVLRPDGFWKG